MSTLRQRRESTDEKAARLLTSGNLRITRLDENHVHAEVRGDHETYDVLYFDGRWRCSCPARTDCSHLRALWLVTVNHKEAAT